MFGRKELGLGKEIEEIDGMDGKAFDSRLRASDPTDDDLPCRVPDWKTDDMALCLDACAEAGGACNGVDIVELCIREAAAGLWASKNPALTLLLMAWSMAMAFSAAGVRVSDSLVAMGLMVGCINDCASSSSP